MRWFEHPHHPEGNPAVTDPDNASTAACRFIAEIVLDEATVKEKPREKLKALRAEFAKKSADGIAAAAAAAETR